MFRSFVGIIFRKYINIMKFGYYPGCALRGASYDYEKSVRACCNTLGLTLEELDDWICCGASAAHSVNGKLAIALPARNLGIAEKMGISQLLAPCPLCSKELLKVNEIIAADENIQREMTGIVELPLTSPPAVINLIQLFQAVGKEAIAKKQVKKLEQFKPACYYGCLLTRPPKTLRFDDCEQPTSMETLLTSLGAAPVDWNYKTECCGAGLTLCDAESVVNLSSKIIVNAIKHNANCIVVACPMCQMNLDMRQADIEKKLQRTLQIPIYYLSDLVGLALGLSAKELCIDRHFVPCPLSTDL